MAIVVDKSYLLADSETLQEVVKGLAESHGLYQQSQE